MSRRLARHTGAHQPETALFEPILSVSELPERVARVERRLRLAPSRSTSTPYEEDLSDRELAGLRLLATDLTQREIGEALHVSFNTIKTHVRSIFCKLDVTTRPEAVSRARDLRLL